MLLNLRHVPDDESDDVRALLDENGIGWYETRPNRWGISAGAIWISEVGDVLEARRLMAQYQQSRQLQAREQREIDRREGREPSFLDVLRNEPARVVLTLVGILLMLGLVALPVWVLHK
jgi:hypothetical protein